MTIDKKNHYNNTVEQFSKNTDALGQPIDKGILETVVVLNLLGFNTTQSCQGHESWGNSFPWVDIKPIEDQEYLNSKENLKVLTSKLLKSNSENLANEELSKSRIKAEEKYQKPTLEIAEKITILLSMYYAEYNSSPYEDQLYVNYSGSFVRLQSHGSTYQILLPKSERILKLNQYQAEMQNFTKFLLIYWGDM